MTIQAISADGVTHEFPDETPDDVINGAMKSYAASVAPPAPEGPGVLGYGKEVAKQLGIGTVANIVGSIQGAGMGGGHTLEATMGGLMPELAAGAEPATEELQAPLEQNPVYQAGKRVQEKATEVLQPSGILPPLAESVVQGFGSVLGNILMSRIPGGIMTIPLQGRGEAAQNVEQRARAALAQPGLSAGPVPTPEQTNRAMGLGTVAGMTEFADSLLPTLGGSTGRALGLIGRVGLRALEGAFVEGGQEGLAKFIQNTIEKGIYNPAKDILEDVGMNALVGFIVGGGTTAVIGGHAHPAEAIAPSPVDVAAAGAGIVAPPPTPTPPTAPTAPVAPTPTVPVVAPADAGAAAPSELGQRLASIIEPMSDSVVEPSINPLVQRGQPFVSATESPIIASGPVETRPGRVEVSPEQVDEQMRRAAEPDITPEMVRSRQQRIAAAVEEGKGVLPDITAGQRVEIPTTKGRKGFATQSVHSTTVGQLVPSLDLSHFTPGDVHEVIAKALVNRLASTIPNMPIHVLLENDMMRAANADGLYYPSNDNMLHLPDSQKGPIFVSTNTFGIPGRFAEVAMHESVHGMTSDVVLRDPVVRERVTKLLDAAKVAYGPASKNLHAFSNEREFITATFTKESFQRFLLIQPISKELWTELGLDTPETPRPLHAKLWDGVMGIIQHIFKLPGKPQEVKTMLEAAVRVGVDTMEAQQRLVEQRRAMQTKFNAVEPELQAVPRQEATRGAYDMMRSLKDHVEGPAAEEMARQLGYADRMNWFYKYMVHAFQLGELNPNLAELQRYLEKMREAGVDEAKINDARIRVTKDWVNLGRNMSERMVALIDDITNMIYRTPIEVQRGIGRKPTQAEFNALVRRHGVNADALQVMQKINKLFDTFLDLSADLARQQALKIVDPVARANAVSDVNQNVANLKSRPYFPFMRYGRYVVTVQNQAGRVIHREHFERRGLKSGEAMQRDAMKRLERAFPAPLYTVRPDILSESSGPMVGMPGLMLDMMAQKLNLSPQQLKALDQLKFEVSPAQSFRHRFQNKSYTAGYSHDFQRSFAQYFFHGAKWYVKTKYADGMRADINAIQNNALSSLTPIKRVQIANFLKDHLENNFLNPKQDFTTFKAGLVFYTLSYVPLSAVVNMSQTPMVTLPHLSGKFGDVQAATALAKAIATGRNYFKKGNLASMTSDEAKALDYGIKSGRLDQNLGSEMASWGQGGNLMGFEGNAVAQTMHSMVEKGMWMFSVAEKWNRRIAYMAARELALKQPNNAYVREALGHYQDELRSMVAKGFSQAEAEAILVAGHVVDQTQFMATPASRPRFMRGKLGSLFLYKRYIQGLMFLTLNNKRDFMPRFLITALLMGGLHSIPGYDDVAEVARVLGYWLFGKDFSADRELRKLMRTLGTDEHVSADQVLHGSARIGFGVPWLLNLLGNAVGQSPTVNQKMGYPSGPDLSRSLGAGPILPIEAGKLLGPPINDPAQMFGEQSARAGGVMGQLAYNFYRAIASKEDPADFKRWELLMPRFAKDLSSAYRAYSEEKVRGKNDTAIVRFDTRDPEHLGEIIGMTGGFQPRRLTARWDELRDQSEQIKFQDTMRGMLLEQWATAIRSQDPNEREKMRVATQEFNANLPSWARGMALTSETIQRSVGMRLKTQQVQEAGFAIQRGRIPLIQEIQSLHPESAVDVRRVR